MFVYTEQCPLFDFSFISKICNAPRVAPDPVPCLFRRLRHRRPAKDNETMRLSPFRLFYTPPPKNPLPQRK